MSAATISAPVIAGPSWTHATRVVLVALAIVVLVAMSFVVGRVTVSTAQQAPAIAPAAPAQTNPYVCRTGRAC